MKKIILLIMLVALVGCSETNDEEVNVENGDEWCAEGTTWSSSSSDGSADMEIIGVVDSGKYENMCHAVYTIDMEGTEGTVDVYFDEDGNGYQVMDINGQKIESEYSS